MQDLKDIQNKIDFLKSLISLCKKHGLLITENYSGYSLLVELDEHNTVEDLESLLHSYKSSSFLD